MLDILGISKEKLGKKNRYGNLLNNALHSYYARYCDILVTNDKGLRDKSAILYHMYDVSTQIVGVQECNEILKDIEVDKDVDYSHLFTKVNHDVKNSERTYLGTLDDGGEVYRLEESSQYFNFFDSFLLVVSENETRYILCKGNSSYLSEPNYREMGKIINRMVNLFSHDSNDKGFFDFASETIAENEPIQRTWVFETITINLAKESLNEKFSLVITLPNA